MRRRLEENASPQNLKRSPGGIVDVEFIAQMLQLQYAGQSPEVLQPGTVEALTALQTAGHLDSEMAEFLCSSYRFLRSIEAGLRLMNTTARHDLPEDERELKKLAYLLRCQQRRRACPTVSSRYTHENRRLFDELFTAQGLSANDSAIRVGQVDHLFTRRRPQHKHLAIADPPGAGDLDDLPHDFADPRVVDPHRDLDLGQERQGEFAVVVLIQVALLPPEPFDLAHHQRLERCQFEPLQDLFRQERFDDCDDLLHAG